MTAQTVTEEQDLSKRVAVIAVHGLGGPPTGRTAQRVAEALLDTEPLPAPVARCQELTVGPAPGTDDYPGEVYHTVVYSTTVTPPTGDEGAVACRADVYEVYWADLSRAGTSVQRLPLDVLELAFFPLHLAEQAFAAERRACPSDRVLAWTHRLFRLAMFLFAGVLPPLSIFLLTRLVVISLARTPEAWPWVVWAVWATAAVAAGWWLTRRWAGRAGSLGAALAASGYLVILVATAIAVWLVKFGLPGPPLTTVEADRYAAAACAEIAFGAGFLLLAQYPLRVLLPRSWPTGFSLWWQISQFGLAAADYGWTYVWGHMGIRPRGYSFEAARLASFEYGWCLEYVVLVVAWAAAVLAAAAGVMSALRARRHWPSGVALWVPLSVMPYLVITSILYFGVWGLLSRNLFPRDDETGKQVRLWIEATGTNLPAFGCLVVGGLVVLLPASTSLLLMTLRWPRLTQLRPKSPEAKREYRVLDAALRVLPWGLGLTFLGVTVGAFVGTWPHVMQLAEMPGDIVTLGRVLPEPKPRTYNVALFAGSAGLLILILVRSALTSRGTGAGGGLKTAIDLAFDVLNYLRGNTRVYPAEGGPLAARAELPGQAEQIYRRFETVLELVRREEKYDAVLIIAHSQGAAITFDLLTRPAHGRPLPLPNQWMLVTLGNPVRQLYGAVFPTQYDRSQFDRWTEVAGQSDGVPRPTRWWNLFYGTDCVGRHLVGATADRDYEGVAYPIDRLTYDGSEGLVEHCIGVDGHTSYWGSKQFLGRVVRQCIAGLLPQRLRGGGGSVSPADGQSQDSRQVPQPGNMTSE